MTTLLAAVLIWTGGPFSPILVTTVLLVVVSLVAASFDRVRGHPASELAKTASTVAVFVLSYVSRDERFWFLLALIIVTVLGVGIELYNYRHGALHPRFD